MYYVVGTVKTVGILQYARSKTKRRMVWGTKRVRVRVN